MNGVRFIICLILCFALSTIYAQQLEHLYKQSIHSYKEKNYPAFLTQTLLLDSLRPSHPAYTYNLAVAYALNNKTAKAAEMLEKLIRTNNELSFENDSDFVSLKHTAAYKDLVALKKQLAQQVKNSKHYVTLSEKDLHPESVVFLPSQKLWLASSIRKRKIVSFDSKTGVCKDWLTDPNMMAVFALKIDSAGKTVWATTSAVPEMQGYTMADEGKAEILKIDIATQQIVERFQTDGNHVFGDLVLDKNGDVYISDSYKPVIYKIAKGEKEMQQWLDLSDQAFNLQGICILSGTILISDYLKGIFKIDLKTKQSSLLNLPSQVSCKGIDGIAVNGNKLITIYNGIKPMQLVEFEMDLRTLNVKGFKITDRARPEFHEPTMGCFVEDVFYFIANSPWAYYNQKFEPDMGKISPPALYRYK